LETFDGSGVAPVNRRVILAIPTSLANNQTGHEELLGKDKGFRSNGFDGVGGNSGWRERCVPLEAGNRRLGFISSPGPPSKL
jgi:hypothetical protein